MEKELAPYQAPEAKYFSTKVELNKAVGDDFIARANEAGKKRKQFFVGLSHGRSPSGVYQYILDHYKEIERPDLIRYTFVNSPLKRQRGIKEVTDASIFLRDLFRAKAIDRKQILGSRMDRSDMTKFAKELNITLEEYLAKQKKEGLDYVILASDTAGRVAGITRNSSAFDSKEAITVVKDRNDYEVSATPHFLLKTKRVVFIATKANKRRPLAWLYYKWGSPDQSPSFLRYMENVEKRMTVYVDDKALTWPQIQVIRRTKYGDSTIRVDLAKDYKENAVKKLPVILMVHGFLGLNTFDSLLTALPSTRYVAAAMHYGSIPDSLPIDDYSKHIMRNINAVIEHFGDLGHDVYLFDHSMANIYFQMMDRDFNKLRGVKTFLKGRIGSNPFFGEETKHATLGFLDTVLIPSMSFFSKPLEKSLFFSMRRIIPVDTKYGVRKRSIGLTRWLIKEDTKVRDRIWRGVKERIVQIMSNMGVLPHLDRIPIIQALNKMPAKIPAIQIHSALKESKDFDQQKGLVNFPKHNIPVLVLQSRNDIVAKFVPRAYDDGHSEVRDITDENELKLFREHLYFMVNPLVTAQTIDEFVKQVEGDLLNNTNSPKKTPSSKTPETVKV